MEGPRCAITKITDETVEMTCKDCHYLADAFDKEKREKELMLMYLQKILGLASKEQIKVAMGDKMKNKVLLLKQIPPPTIFERLNESMNLKQEYGATSLHGVYSAEFFERMPKTAGATFGDAESKKPSGSGGGGVAKWGDDERGAEPIHYDFADSSVRHPVTK